MNQKEESVEKRTRCREEELKRLMGGKFRRSIDGLTKRGKNKSLEKKPEIEKMQYRPKGGINHHTQPNTKRRRGREKANLSNWGRNSRWPASGASC